MNEGFILLDTNYEILMINKKAKQLFSDKMEVNQLSKILSSITKL